MAETDTHRPQAPFILEHRRLYPRPDGGFTPDAAVIIPSTLRSNGLLAALDPEDVEVLLAVLSGATANGGFVATPETVGEALGIGAEAAYVRLHRLASAVWRDGPLLSEQREESGLRLFAPSAQLFEVRTVEVAPPGALARPAEALRSHRDEVLAHSRASYGRPRVAVEAEIDRFLLGEEEPKSPEEAARFALRRRLLGAGLTREQADRLLDAFAASEIERQLDWLPHRHARNPAGYLIAAVEGDYEEPPALRRALAVEADVAPEPAALAVEAGQQPSEGLPIGGSLDLDLP